MNRIYLVGYMGAGKSTAARRLATRLGFTAYDTDTLFEERFKISVDDFFHKYDEALFRKLETQMLQSTENLQDAVIATGGGTPCFNNNMTWMNEHGTTVFLRISPKAAVDRLLHAKRKRPLVELMSEEELAEFVQNHYASRLPFYEQAKVCVKAEDLDLDNLIKLIENE